MALKCSLLLWKRATNEQQARKGGGFCLVRIRLRVGVCPAASGGGPRVCVPVPRRLLSLTSSRRCARLKYFYDHNRALRHSHSTKTLPLAANVTTAAVTALAEERTAPADQPAASPLVATDPYDGLTGAQRRAAKRRAQDKKERLE